MQETTVPLPQQASPWILNPASDLGLFIATPLLILLVFTAPMQAIAGDGPRSTFKTAAPVAAPNNLTQVVTYGGRTITLRMTKETVRGPNFEVLVQNSSGGYDIFTAGEVRTYIGTVDGYPGAMATGILKTNGTLWSQVFFGRGYTWKALGSSVYQVKGDTVPDYSYPTRDTLSPGHVGSDTYLFEVGVDMDFRYLSLRKDVAACLEATEFTISQLKAVYIRDALLQPALGRVIVRGSQAHCPYDSSTSNLLGILRDEWNTNQTTADRDIACLASPAQGGGVAWVGVIGGGLGYSSNGLNKGDGSFNNVLRHEIGHNWGIHDYHAGSPEGKTIMCGNSRGRFAGPSVRSMMIERDEVIAKLDNQGRYSTIDIPPYAALDLTRVGYGASVTVDVVANDHDANGHSRSLFDFDTSSVRGGTLSRSIGTGPGGRDEVIYQAPSGLGPAMDTFHYRVADSSGMRSKGLVMVLFGPPTPNKHWAFESNTKDSGTSPQVHGKLQGGAVVGDCDAAVRSGALRLNGTSAWFKLDHAAMEARIYNCTVSLWFKAAALSGRQMLYEEGGVSNGLAIRLNGSVLEARAKSGSNFGDTSVAGIRAGVWNFVAVTFARGNLSLYLNDGTTPDNTAAGNWTIGAHSDPAGIGARHQQDCFGRTTSGDRFQGSIDDVQVFDGEALNGNLVEDLFFQGPSTWFDEGSGLAGIRGEPRLLCNGPLTTNRINTLHLCNGAPSALSVLVIGGTRAPTPFLGGLLIPAPHVVSAVLLTSEGEQSFRVPTTPGVPPGVSFWLQWLVFDSAAAQGVAFSNAIHAVTR